MLQLIALFGVLIILACAYGLADPQGLMRHIEKFSSVGGYIFAIVVRVILGAAALMAAADSLLPVFLEIIGGISLIAAAVLLLIGKGRFSRLIQWVASFNSSFLRLWLVFGMLFGVAMVWVTGIVG